MRKTAQEANLLRVTKPFAGGKYHVGWAYTGCIWRCSEVLDNGKVILVTPRSRKKIVVDASDLYHTREVTEKIKLKQNQL